MREYWLDPPAYKNPVCPICGQECETIYKDMANNEVVGCDQCILAVDAYQWQEDEDENAEASQGDEEFESRREMYFERRYDG